MLQIADYFDKHKLLIFFLPFFLYMANGRELSSGDTVPTVFVAVNLVQQGTVFLDNLHDYVPYHGEPYYVSRQQGHLVSNYPIFPGIMAAPIFAPFVWMGMIQPGDGDLVWKYLAATSGACFTALSVLFLYLALKFLLDNTGALILAMAYGLGTALWPIAGQSLWQHGPSVMWWTLAFWTFLKADRLAPNATPWLLLFLCGVSAGNTFLCRNVNAIGIFFLGLAVLSRFRWQSIYFFLPVAFLASALLIYNYSLFGYLTGGYEELLKLQWALDRIETGRWATPIHIGFAGQLISPSRGILIFSPFLIFSFWGMARILIQKTPDSSLLAWLIPAPIIMLLLFSKYSVWWGGNSHFGPRYQIETYPFLLLFVAAAWPKITRSKGLIAIFVVLVLYSISIQFIGAFCYPSQWAGEPVPLAQDKSRFWNWSYNQIVTCAKSGIKMPFQ